MSFTVRLLTPDDWKIWKEIRLESLRVHPDAYGASYEEAVVKGDAYFQDALVVTDIFGAFKDGALVGVSRFSIGDRGIKQKHKGSMVSVYLQEKHRGQGVADALVTAVIEHAKQHVSQLHCTVVSHNAGAIKLYQKHGFTTYGTQPRALKVGDQYYDELAMVRIFN